MSSKLEIHGVVKHDFQVERVEDSFESDANGGKFKLKMKIWQVEKWCSCTK
jgi:hypothetical protein